MLDGVGSAPAFRGQKFADACHRATTPSLRWSQWGSNEPQQRRAVKPELRSLRRSSQTGVCFRARREVRAPAATDMHERRAPARLISPHHVSSLTPSCAGEMAAKAVPPQDGADRGLDDPQLNRNLVLRLAFVAQRPDLLGQLRVDNLAAHGNLPGSRLPAAASGHERRREVSLLEHHPGPRSAIRAASGPCLLFQAKSLLISAIRNAAPRRDDAPPHDEPSAAHAPPRGCDRHASMSKRSDE